MTNVAKTLQQLKAESVPPEVAQIKDDIIANQVVAAVSQEKELQDKETTEYAKTVATEEESAMFDNEIQREQDRKRKELEAYIKERTKIRVEDEFLHGSIQAKPLGQVDILNLKPRDPAYVFRWVQRKAQGGQLYEQRIAMGFTNAVMNDVANYKPATMVSSDGTNIMAGDLILMKVRKVDYYAALKHNFIKSSKQITTDGSRQIAKRKAEEEMGSVPSALAGKISIFDPGSSFSVPLK